MKELPLSMFRIDGKLGIDGETLIPWDCWLEVIEKPVVIVPRKKKRKKKKIKVKVKKRPNTKTLAAMREARSIRVVKKKISSSKLFLQRKEWKNLREIALAMYGRICSRCGSEENIQVDHIKPKSRYPELALDIKNLQPLCWPCNKDKSFRDETDYRK